MGTTARTHPSNTDLLAVWPESEVVVINPAQALVAYNDDNQPVGGILFWDAGHSAVYATDMVILVPEHRIQIGRVLLDNFQAHLEKVGVGVVMFTSKDDTFVQMALKKGAKSLGQATVFAIRTDLIGFDGR